MRRWRWVGWIILVVLATAPLTPAQDQPSGDDLRRRYDDTLAQLKDAQDRKNELGVENEKLKARIAELEAQLTESNTKSTGLQEQIDAFAQRTFYMRAELAAWKAFLDLYPTLRLRWNVFLQSDLLGRDRSALEIHDPNWPFTTEG